MKVLFILQNAWSGAYAGRTWPRRSWLPALHSSRSGQRLKVITEFVEAICMVRGIPLDSFEFDYDNTTPIVGATPKSVVKPDKKHLKRVLREGRPDVVVTCGSQAADAVDPLWGGYTIVVPHPAYRMLTNDLYKLAARFIVTGGGSQVIELTQGKGEIIVKHHG